MSQEQNSAVQENKMGVMPVNKLLLNMSLPMMASMLVQALYNIVDSIFVAKLSENALTAVSLAFPIQTLIIAIGVGTGVGANALLAKQLGEKKFERVNKTAMNAILLSFIYYVLFIIMGFVVVRPFYKSQVTAADVEILEMGVDYLFIVCVGSLGLCLQLIGEKLLQATGKTVHSMIAQGLGAITNIILDPILIFGMFGLPKMGVAGAAIATVIGQIVGGIISVYFNVSKNHEIKFEIKGFRPDMETIGNIYKVGLPSIIMQSIGSIMTYGMNQILIAFVFIKKQILLPRTEDELLTQINDFITYEIDECVCACAALHIYDNQAEIAAVAVDETYSHLGIGPKLIEHLITKAKNLNLQSVFILTTQSADWFEKLGFQSDSIDSLPEERKKFWTPERNSKVYRLKI